MCTDCNPTPPLITYPPPLLPPCNPCEQQDCQDGYMSAKCIFYEGTSLSCIESGTRERLDLVLQKMDEKLCAAGFGSVDPLSFNAYCLSPASTLDNFLEKLSLKYCTLSTSLDTLTATTLPAAITGLNTSISGINHPGLTSCPAIGIVESDTVKQILSKLSTRVCNIYSDSLNLAQVNWNSCFSLQIAPITIQEGFQALINQICILSARTSSSPGIPFTFDNTGSCLPSPGAADDLPTTILKIRSRLCNTPTFNPLNLAAACLPITANDSLETVLNTTIAGVSDALKNAVRAVNPAHFTLSAIDPLNPCLGKLISLNTSISDRLVAATATDNSPGTLADKLIAGNNITIDNVTLPGKLVISSTGGQSAADAFKVKTDATDNFPAYLRQKLQGVTNTISAINITADAGIVSIESTVSIPDVVEAMMELLENDDDLRARFCNLIRGCPSPCQPPTNIQAIVVP